MTSDEVTQPFHPFRCPRCKLETVASTPFCTRCKLDLRYGSPGKVQSGKCVYCTKTRKFSEEHAFGKWLKKRYGGRHTRTRHWLRRPERVAFWENIPVHTESVDLPAPPYDTVVLNVCAECNNGWMSRLQNSAAPLVETLADGKWPDFSDEQRDLIVRWVLMVSINFECLGKIPHTTQQQRTLLRDGVIPPGCRISIAHMQDASCTGDSFSRTVALPIGIGPSEYLTMQSTYFCVEQAAFHTLTSLGDQTLEIGIMSSGLSNARLPRMIWPVLEPLTDATLTRLRGSDLNDVQRCFGPV
ncbi:hypothetical protein P3T43_003152 [Paraburkholderia sp. GAS41]|jgi:hypothetical protein|uniref:hypothetical protein n=1 Tax=Paraburkholderia sp. GAS41 TaxID=3035134 RepID=UPI003D1A162C